MKLRTTLFGALLILLALIGLVVFFLPLFWAVGFTLLFISFFVWSVTFWVITPLIKLSEATDPIMKGKYDEAEIPIVGRRQDELAKLTRSFDHMVQGLKERENIRAVLDKVVSREVADEILKNRIQLGGEDRVVTMLFSDIRGFTALTEQFSPQKTISLLNLYMTRMSRVIESEGGLIDKYVGDEIMALFGAPVFHAEHALRALSAGMLMIETINLMNAERKQQGEPLFEMGIGIHTGLVVAGNMGAEDRLNYTVLGRNVNLAARLCDVAKAGQLLISEHTLREPSIQSSFIVKQLDPITLKGFLDPVRVYEVVGFRWE